VENSPLKIVRFGDEVLEQIAAPVNQLGENLKALIELMKETMYQAPGVGLAAPQVGRSLQLAVIDPSLEDHPASFMVLINPEIIAHEGENTDMEGCLSLPGFSFPIRRFDSIMLKYFDLQGKEYREEFTGFKARVVQHEMDHLNGRLILDHLTHLKRSLVKQEIKKLKKSGQW